MPKFAYVSRNEAGERVTAIAEAPSSQHLFGQLQEMGLSVVDIQELGSHGSIAKPAPQRLSWKRLTAGRITSSELAVFWREFATMIAAGLPVIEALESIVQELQHVKLHRTLTTVISCLWEGLTFSQSLAKHPRTFSPMVVALIGAAEESGALGKVADQIASFLEKRDQIIRKVRAALTYPIFLCGFFLLVMAVATFWIIPQFRQIYEGFKAKLPPLTEIVFAINAFILAYLPWVALGLIGSCTAFVLWARRPEGRATLDRLALKLPVFGELLQLAAVSRLCRSLALLLGGGIPVARAMEMAQESSGNTVVSRAVRTAREEIVQGSKIAAAFKRQRPIFPQLVVRMVAAGEETGSLGSLLEKAADFYESRVDAALMTINALIEPIMIVMIGAFVLIFVLSMYMPIFMLAMSMK